MPLKGICLLSRGTDNGIRPLRAEDGAEFLLDQCFLPEQPELAKAAQVLAERLIRSVPLWQMECNKEPGAAVAAYEAMK